MNRLKKFLKILGPGFITGASDDDPSGIATYAQTGTLFGYSQLWLSIFSYPFMTVIQEMCGRIGMVTGLGISGVIKRHFPKPILYFAVGLLLIANTINIGADLGAMASSAQLVVGIPFVFWLIILTAFSLLLEVLVSYPAYAKFLKYLTLSLFAYIATTFVIKEDWAKILHSTFVPYLSSSRDYVFNIVAFLGTTISPYLFFWQADEEVEEEIEEHKLRTLGKGIPRITIRDVREMRFDTAIGMFFSNLVTFFIIVTTASTLGIHGIKFIETADQAALALRPFAGDFAFLLFALGIIGTGLLAVPILAGSASYGVAEAFNLRAGLSKKFTQAHGFYTVLIVAMIIGLFVNFTPIKPFQMLYYTAILNGICAPPLMIMVLFISNNKKIMREHTNNTIINVLGIVIVSVMSISSILLLINLWK